MLTLQELTRKAATQATGSLLLLQCTQVKAEEIHLIILLYSLYWQISMNTFIKTDFKWYKLSTKRTIMVIDRLTEIIVHWNLSSSFLFVFSSQASAIDLYLVSIFSKVPPTWSTRRRHFMPCISVINSILLHAKSKFSLPTRNMNTLVAGFQNLTTESYNQINEIFLLIKFCLSLATPRSP